MAIKLPDFMQRQKSMEELEEENDREEIQLSIAQKKAAIAELNARGMSVRDFKQKRGGISWSGIMNFLRNH